MILIDVQNFLELPDWKKIQFKMTQSKFNNYPIQTKQQEYERRDLILQICSYFAMQDFKEFIDNISQITFDGLWPMAMELFITPRLLDILPYQKLLKFSYCNCCANYQGYNKQKIYSQLNKTKVHSIFGICTLAQNENYSKSLIRVSPYQRCVSWNPLRIYEQIIDFQIKSFLERKNNIYTYKDYKKDLNTIDIWDYFQNRYKTKG